MAADSASASFRNEGHAFSLKGSAKRLGAMRRAMLVQYRAMTSVRARNARTDTRLATIAVIRVLCYDGKSKAATTTKTTKTTPIIETRNPGFNDCLFTPERERERTRSHNF